jgi:Mn-dependent DtxR family transcriptional regulator
MNSTTETLAKVAMTLAEQCDGLTDDGVVGAALHEIAERLLAQHRLLERVLASHVDLVNDGQHCMRIDSEVIEEVRRRVNG